MIQRRITIFCGAYGSGKTEISLNSSLLAKKQRERVALVDLDIVNPYFRAAEHRAALESAGIRVLCPTFAMTTVDIPGLPAEIQSVFDKKDETVIMDVGGDSTGSVALGRYKPFFDADDCEMLFVVNARRPFSSNSDEIAELCARVEARARMKAAALVSNTNIGAETDLDIVLKGHEVIGEAAKLIGIPVRAVCAARKIAASMPAEMSDITFPLDLMTRPEWF